MQGVFFENIQNVLKFMKIYGMINYVICDMDDMRRKSNKNNI